MFDTSKLAGRIVEKYGTRSAFAEAIGVNVATISSKLRGRASISTQDIIKWSGALGIGTDDIGIYFFSPKS